MNRERCDWWLIIAVDAIYTTSRVPLKVYFPKPFPYTPMSVLLRVLTIKRNKAAYQMRGDVNINCGSLGLIRWQLWNPTFAFPPAYHICPPRPVGEMISELRTEGSFWN